MEEVPSHFKQMTIQERKALLAQVRELTNHGRHAEAKELYDMVMDDFRGNAPA